MVNLKIYEEERPWGNFRQFTHNTSSTVKIITVKENEELSLQSHKNRLEFWHILKGSGIIEIENIKYEAKEGDEYNIPQNIKHRIKAKEGGISVLEIATGEFNEKDIIHYEDKYNRL